MAIGAIILAAGRGERMRPLSDTCPKPGGGKVQSQRIALIRVDDGQFAKGLAVFAFPAAIRKLLRTTNGVERLHREVRRRARVVSIFPYSASCLRLVSAVLTEISEEWLTGRTYITFETTA